MRGRGGRHFGHGDGPQKRFRPGDASRAHQSGGHGGAQSWLLIPSMVDNPWHGLEQRMGLPHECVPIRIAAPSYGRGRHNSHEHGAGAASGAAEPAAGEDSAASAVAEAQESAAYQGVWAEQLPPAPRSSAGADPNAEADDAESDGSSDYCHSHGAGEGGSAARGGAARGGALSTGDAFASSAEQGRMAAQPGTVQWQPPSPHG